MSPESGALDVGGGSRWAPGPIEARLQALISAGIHHPLGPVRKAVRLLLHAPRAVHQLADGAARRALAPPVLSNSVPKSGTHLLDQILAALPRRRNYGRFLESMTASYLFEERTSESTLHFLASLVSGELVRAHLHHSPEAERATSAHGIAHFLIYRDPRDVAISEAHYLRSMNRWHKLHPHFARLGSQSEAVSLCIEGLASRGSPLPYPDIGQRYARFLPWLRAPAVHGVRFEDLMSPRRAQVIEALVQFYARQAGEAVDVAAVAAAAEARIAPERSHTFRKGKSGGWREVLTPAQKDTFKALTGDLLMELGYEETRDW